MKRLTDRSATFQKRLRIRAFGTIDNRSLHEKTLKMAVLICGIVFMSGRLYPAAAQDGSDIHG